MAQICVMLLEFAFHAKLVVLKLVTLILVQLDRLAMILANVLALIMLLNAPQMLNVMTPTTKNVYLEAVSQHLAPHMQIVLRYSVTQQTQFAKAAPRMATVLLDMEISPPARLLQVFAVIIALPIANVNLIFVSLAILLPYHPPKMLAQLA